MFKLALVLCVALVFVKPTESIRFRRVRRVLNNVVEAVKQPVACKILFSLGCPAAVGTAATALGVGSGGTGAAVVGVGVNQCMVHKENCKRSVPDFAEILIPFSDNMSDFDGNGDGRISYEEFVSAVERTVRLADDEELFEPFIIADADGDEQLDEDEFKDAPFLFADASVRQTVKVKDVPNSTLTVSVEDVTNATMSPDEESTV